MHGAGQYVVVVLGCFHQDAFGQFQFQPLRRNPGIRCGGRDRAGQFPRCLELHARYVDGHQRRRDAGVQPLPELAACLLDDPSTEWNDEAAALRLGDEPAWPEHALRRMAPSDQGLNTQDLPRLDIDLGLIDKKELVRGERLADLCPDGHAGADLTIDVVGKEPE